MTPGLRAVTPQGTPTMPLIAAWRAKGGVPGLPAAAVIVKQDGAPTGLLVSLARQALGLTLNAREPIVSPDGKLTRSFLTKWDAL